MDLEPKPFSTQSLAQPMLSTRRRGCGGDLSSVSGSRGVDPLLWGDPQLSLPSPDGYRSDLLMAKEISWSAESGTPHTLPAVGVHNPHRGRTVRLPVSAKSEAATSQPSTASEYRHHAGDNTGG